MEPSEVISGRYRLEEPIGRGGMATIFRAVDEHMMDRPVAVKVLREVYSSDPQGVTRFQRGARAQAALPHPNIVQVFDYGQSYGQSGDSYYIVMEYIDGMDLRRYLKRRGVLPIERGVQIARDVALGLGAAHRRGIVHRDVKPTHVMLNDDGLVKLTGFEIVSLYKDGDERLTPSGQILGNARYFAPEQARGEIVRPSADIYALGVVMYEMLASRTPFDGDTPLAVAMKHIREMPEPPSALNPHIPPSLERIILRCLDKDPQARFRDGDALAAVLDNFLRARAPVRDKSPTIQGQPLSADASPRSETTQAQSKEAKPALGEVGRTVLRIFTNASTQAETPQLPPSEKPDNSPRQASTRVFVSHSHVDNDWCMRLVSALANNGFDVWFDKQGLFVGDQWIPRLESEIESRDVFLIVLTPDSWDSKWVRKELQLALHQDKRIIGVMPKPVALSGFITTYQILNVAGQDASHVAQQVAERLKA